jgi:mannose-6-phosphate isomerase-like protein (cupin superfamily)
VETTIVRRGTAPALDVLGPTVEILASGQCCTILGTVPPGVCVPLHAHDDFEDFFVVSGVVQVLVGRAGGFEWVEARPGDFIHIPGGTRHAFRNTSGEPVVQLITTTPTLGRFFREVGRPVGSALPASPEELRQFAETSARYGHWLGSPEENAAVGIPSPQSRS